MLAKSRITVVLGMHRSGTSAVSGVLEELGVDFGDVNRCSPDNVKGNLEAPELKLLNDDILDRSHGAWDNPPPIVRWSPVHHVLARMIVEQRAHSTHWGFKDPRTLLTLGGWLKHVPDANLLGVFRHPFLVANSLKKRNKISFNEGLILWMQYNRILLWHFNNLNEFPLIEFSEDSVEFLKQVREICCLFGLEHKPPTFYNPALKHQSLPKVAEGKHTQDALVLYNKLKARSILPVVCS